MFKFDFNIEDPDNELGEIPNVLNPKVDQQKYTTSQPFIELPISQLLDSLPSQISYSQIAIPLPCKKTLHLVRRDLFDARFQLISESGAAGVDSDKMSPLDFIESPSDLVPGIYEGGLKTWECSLDLVSYLTSLGFPDEAIRSKRIFEIGCGTAIPSIYLLSRLLSIPPPADPNMIETQFHLQDYNASVLELVSLPNVLLTWYMSAASVPYRESAHKASNIPGSFIPDPSIPSELQITPKLKAAFLSSLYDLKISLRFFSGSWDTFDISTTGGIYNVVLTSETIYRTDSLPSLINLMRTASGSWKDVQNLSDLSSLCLVAAKVIYFGVSGGVSEFADAIIRSKFPDSTKESDIEVVWELNMGVGRKVMLVRWR